MIKVFVRKTASVLNLLFAALEDHVLWVQSATKDLSWSTIRAITILNASPLAVSPVPKSALSSLNALNLALKTHIV